METKAGFTKMTTEEVVPWLGNLKIARTVIALQQHHTYIPDYSLFSGNNHFELQSAMKNYHVHQNGWNDIGQHFTVFPDGVVVTGRSLEKSPACITGQNANMVCIENLGNFDKGKDVMTVRQRTAIVALTAALCDKFSLIPTANSIVYHHWFNMANGERNNGTKNNKSCPGTSFFGGNKVADFEAHFLPEVFRAVNTEAVTQPVLRYVAVNSEALNIRVQPAASAALAKNRSPVLLGSLLRVYGTHGVWLKISGSEEHWVNGNFTHPVVKAVTTASQLNVRSGPGTNHPKTGVLLKNTEVFLSGEDKGWCQITMTPGWVSKHYLKFL